MKLCRAAAQRHPSSSSSKKFVKLSCFALSRVPDGKENRPFLSARYSIIAVLSVIATPSSTRTGILPVGFHLSTSAECGFAAV